MRTRRHALIPAPARQVARVVRTIDGHAVVSLLHDGRINLSSLRPSGL